MKISLRGGATVALAFLIATTACLFPEAREDGGSGGGGGTGGAGGADGAGGAGGAGGGPVCPSKAYDVEITSNSPVVPTELARSRTGAIAVASTFGSTVNFGPSSLDPSPTSPDSFILGIDPEGRPAWSVLVGGPDTTSPEDVVALAPTPDGGFIAIGSGNLGFDVVDADAHHATGDHDFIVKLDADGKLVWGREIHAVGGALPKSVAVDDESGEVFVVGSAVGDITSTLVYPSPDADVVTAPGTGGQSPWMLRLESAGQSVAFELWQTNEGSAEHVIISKDHQARYVAGRCASPPAGLQVSCGAIGGNNDAFIVRLKDDASTRDVFDAGASFGSASRYDAAVDVSEADDGDLLLLITTDGTAVDDFAVGDTPVAPGWLNDHSDFVVAKVGPALGAGDVRWVSAITTPDPIDQTYVSISLGERPVISLDVVDGTSAFHSAGSSKSWTSDADRAEFLALNLETGDLDGVAELGGNGVQIAADRAGCGDTILGGFQGQVTIFGTAHTLGELNGVVAHSPEGLTFMPP